MFPSAIGPYRIEERLGAGGMGEVYRAYDDRLERWVAVKVVRADRLDEDDASRTAAAARERFRREARAIAGLSHPNIVQIHDILQRDDGDCIVMELVEGETLARTLRRGRLPLHRAMTIAREIAEGLAAAHGKGVIHRDLKPENVMISADGRAKILDFGLAKRFGPESRDTTLSIHGKVVGTSHAMSPEQAQGLPVDHRSDLFSFGSLLYEMVAGCAPFRRDTLAQTLTWVCTRDPAPAHAVVQEVPVAVSRLIGHLLEKDPERRPESAGRVADVLRYLEREIPETGADGEPLAGSGDGFVTVPSERESESAVATLLGLPRPAYAPGDPPASPPEPSSAPVTEATAGEPTRAGGRTRRRRPAVVAAALVAAALAATIAVGTLTNLVPAGATDVYVAVPAPTVTLQEEIDSADLLPSAVRVALLQELLSLEGVTALAPDQVDAVTASSSTDLARALAADEVFSARLDCRIDTCRATLNRVRGQDGGLLWTQMFDVPHDDLLRLSHAVGERVRRAYGERSLRQAGARLAIGGEEYEDFLRIREAFRTRLEDDDLESLLQRVSQVRRKAPRFLAAYLLEAEIARARFLEETRGEEDLDRAFRVIEAARELAPDDPQPLYALVDIALAAGRLDLADAALEQLEALDPPEAEIQARRARVLSRRGRSEEALELMRAVIARRPSEENLARIAVIEMDQGAMDAARGHLQTLLERAPDSYFGRARLAQLEMMSGRMSRAVQLYQELAERSPNEATWTNLGLAYMLQGRYPEAVEAFRSMDAAKPRSPILLLNLADAELLSGRTEVAEALYHQVLETTASDPAVSDWQILSLRAQAFAHLGRATDAVALAQEVLRMAPENPQAAFEAAVVYALSGERRSALVNAERALELGVEPVWFGFSWFDDLRQEPELRALLKGSDRSEQPPAD